MNFRSRALLDLCYEFDCLLRIEGVCTGGTGEPCHANWPEHGKGAGMKAHDGYTVPGCRACHMALDQGSKLSGEQRKDIWLRAYWKYQPMLWERGLLAVNARPVSDPVGTLLGAMAQGVVAQLDREIMQAAKPQRRRKSRCTTERALPRRY